MKAIILAAGVGQRLQQPQGERFPKCLLRFDGRTLLERHLRLLREAGIEEVVLGLGYAHEQVEAELDRLGWQPRPRIVLNPQYRLGSVLTVHAVAEALRAGEEVLLFDADVLYDARIMQALTQGSSGSRVLLDRDFEAGDEPVKLCIRDGRPVELRKRVDPALRYDTVGESVGFFRFDAAAACRLADIVADYVTNGRADQPHEEAVRDFLLEGRHAVAVSDVTGLPWIEIDFPQDVVRARDDVLPTLQPLTSEIRQA